MRSRRGRTLDGRALSVDLRGVTLRGLDSGGMDLSGARDLDAGWTRAFRFKEDSVCLGDDRATWDAASNAVLAWGVKTRSGFSVHASDGTRSTEVVRAGRRYWLVARLGPLRIREPVEVVAVVDEEDRKGFAYGTLQGHPVSGEEAFVVERRPDGTTWFTNRSLTGPPAGRWRWVYPAALLAQPVYRRRYLRSLE